MVLKKFIRGTKKLYKSACFSPKENLFLSDNNLLYSEIYLKLFI